MSATNLLSYEEDNQDTTEGVAVDSTEDSRADSQVHRATPGEIYSSARARLTQTQKLTLHYE